MSALCASGITMPKPALNGSILFHHIVKTPPLKLDFMPNYLTHRFLLPNPQPNPKPIVYDLNFNQASLPQLAFLAGRPTLCFP